MSVAGPRMAMVEKLVKRCAHLDDVPRAMITAMWSLGASGSVESADWITLKSNLTDDSDLATTVHKIDAALVNVLPILQSSMLTVQACLGLAG